MASKRSYSTEIRALIVAHHTCGISNRKISKLLNIPRRTVDYQLKRYQETKSFSDKKRLEDLEKAVNGMTNT